MKSIFHFGKYGWTFSPATIQLVEIINKLPTGEFKSVEYKNDLQIANYKKDLPKSSHT